MAAVGSYPDNIRVYLSGASYTGGPQCDHSLSLGGYRSARVCTSFVWHRFNPIRGIRIDYVSGRCSQGIGYLEAVTTDSIRWKPPGASLWGAAVSVANGDTVVLPNPDGAYGEYIVISRVSATGLVGVETVQLVTMINNAAGGQDFTASETVAGGYRYTALFVTGATAGAGNLIATATGCDVAFETPGAGGNIQTIANETTAPTGLTFGATASGSRSGGVTNLGMWIRRAVSAGGVSPLETVSVSLLSEGFTGGGVGDRAGVTGSYRAAGDASLSVDGYKFYQTVGTPPDPETTAATGFSATLPWESAACSVAPGTHYVGVSKVNKYGLVGPMQIHRVVLESDSTEGLLPTQAPLSVTVKSVADGKIRVWGLCDYNSDPQPTHWLIYLTSDGTDPDPDTDTPVSVAMAGSDTLDWTSPTTYMDGAPIKALVRTSRIAAPLSSESENTTAISLTHNWFGPDRVYSQTSIAQLYGIVRTPTGPPDSTVVIDETNNVYWECLVGETRLWADSDLVFTIRYCSGADLAEFRTTLGIVAEDVTGSTSGITTGTWDAGSKQIFIGVNGVRVCEIDMVAETIKFSALNHVTAPITTSAEYPFWPRYDASCLQVWDGETDRFVTVASFASDGSLRSSIAWKKCSTQVECLA